MTRQISLVRKAVQNKGKPATTLPDALHLKWIAEHIMPCEPALRSWLNNSVRCRTTVDDITQECYARFCSLDVSGITNARGYFFRMARNLLIETSRQNNIHYLASYLDIPENFLKDETPSAAEHYETKRELDWLRREMLHLPSPEKEAFFWRKIHNLPYDEIALRLGVTERSARRYVMSGLTKLMQKRDSRTPK